MSHKKGSRDRERLEEALRANLHRRKAWMRGRKIQDSAEVREEAEAQEGPPRSFPDPGPD